MSRRIGWTSGLLLVLACASACSSGTPCDAAANVYLELSGGTSSVASPSSISVTGSCEPGFGGCVPIDASCDTSACACRLEVQINRRTLAAGQTELCHLRVVSTTGAVFSKDLSFVSSAGSCISGPSGIVEVSFSEALPQDAGATSDAKALDSADASDASTADTKD